MGFRHVTKGRGLVARLQTGLTSRAQCQRGTTRPLWRREVRMGAELSSWEHLEKRLPNSAATPASHGMGGFSENRDCGTSPFTANVEKYRE